MELIPFDDLELANNLVSLLNAEQLQFFYSVHDVPVL